MYQQTDPPRSPKEFLPTMYEKQRADNAEQRSQELEALLVRYQEQFGNLSN